MSGPPAASEALRERRARFGLQRFLDAQQPVLEQVRAELSEGRKRTHWMWFVFPQLRGLGHSPTARHYAIASLEEAQAYLDDPQLGARLTDWTALVLSHAGRPVTEIFGYPDDRKFHSCMTLFAQLPDTSPLFEQALARFFGGQADVLTLEALKRQESAS